MDENDIIVEQPTESTVQATAVDGDMGEKVQSVGSTNFGKFKDAKSLYDAYNELQSEFTRKCQRLRELESKSVDNVVNATPNTVDTSWQDVVGEFVNTHRHAKAYSKDITRELLKDDSLKHDKYGLEIAYSRVMESKFQSRDEMMQDRAFVNEYILNNEDIKKEIIKGYLDSINRAPTVVQSRSSVVSLLPKPKATNLTDAKKIVEDMLKN